MGATKISPSRTQPKKNELERAAVVAVDPGDAKSKKNLYDVLFGRFTCVFAAIAIPVSFFLPVDGLGIGICWIKRWFELPCPGCGLTRSITSISHLEFLKAWDYHPFGILIYLLLATNLVLLVVPRSWNKTMRAYLEKYEFIAHLVYRATVGYFLVFGFWRMACHYWAAIT